MNIKRLAGIAWPLAAVLALGGVAMASPASTTPKSSSSESHDAARLLRGIRLDARQVRAMPGSGTCWRNARRPPGTGSTDSGTRLGQPSKT